MIDDLFSHRSSWRNALFIARDHAEYDPPDIDDKSYWKHEIEVFDKTFDKIPTVDQLWEALKKQCCGDPEKATRIVMLSEKDFRATMKAAIGAL